MAVAPVDVEADVRTVLLSVTPVVGTTVPNPRPTEFIKITRAGGNRSNLVQERPMIIVECWAENSVDAIGLAGRAWAAMEGEYGPNLNMSSPMNFPDPESRQARYQFTAWPFINLKEVS